MPATAAGASTEIARSVRFLTEALFFGYSF